MKLCEEAVRDAACHFFFVRWLLLLFACNLQDTPKRMAVAVNKILPYKYFCLARNATCAINCTCTAQQWTQKGRSYVRLMELHTIFERIQRGSIFACRFWRFSIFLLSLLFTCVYSFVRERLVLLLWRRIWQSAFVFCFSFDANHTNDKI